MNEAGWRLRREGQEGRMFCRGKGIEGAGQVLWLMGCSLAKALEYLASRLDLHRRVVDPRGVNLPCIGRECLKGPSYIKRLSDPVRAPVEAARTASI